MRPRKNCPECHHANLHPLEVTCPTCGYEFRSILRLRLVALLSSVLAAGCGFAMLFVLARPPLSLGPFDPWPGGPLGEFFLWARRLAFAAIALGLGGAVMIYRWLWRRNR